MSSKYCPYCGSTKIASISIIGDGCTGYFCSDCETKYDLRKRVDEF